MAKNPWVTADQKGRLMGCNSHACGEINTTPAAQI